MKIDVTLLLSYSIWTTCGW